MPIGWIGDSNLNNRRYLSYLQGSPALDSAWYNLQHEASGTVLVDQLLSTLDAYMASNASQREDVRTSLPQLGPELEFPGAVVDPALVAICRQAGHTLAECSLHDFASWSMQGVRMFEHWLATQNLVDFEGVLSSTSRQRAGLPSGSAHPWSFPDVLFDQLAWLAQHPYSARWAEQTLAILTAVTRENHSQQELVNTLLRRLSGSAQEAVQLAEDAEDDRLRAELLRAHWALARRIDCWAVMHDIRLASIERVRVATRGSLNSLFDGPPLPEEMPSNLQTLSANLEEYEQSRDPALARQIAESNHALQSSPDDLERSLAGAVEQHYRNANIRIAITAEMLNRLVAGQRSESGAVRDCIVGTPVVGKSHTLIDSRLALAPETGRWRMELETKGVVESSTTSDGGQARLFSQGTTDFVARKTVVVDPQGVRMEAAVAIANNRNRVIGVTTDFDWIPLLGSFARSQAMNQYREKRLQGKAEVEFKVASRAMARLDQEAIDRIERIEQDVRDRFLVALEQAGITLTTVELASTSERVVTRLRLAGDYQLAGHTPRPRALSDSLASLQLHESALTNAAVALGLNGKRLTAPELQSMLREKFPGMALKTPPEAREDTIFQFAYQDAVRFHIADGKLELAIAIDDFQQAGHRIRGFVVHAYYVPVLTGLQADLVRDGAIGIEGRLGSTERARLHSVFKEILTEERRLPLIRLEDPADPRITGLMVSQLVLEDGWLGLAIGPEASGRVAERSRSLR